MPSRRVMIVDDHAEVRASISSLARRWGHTVEVAPDGETGLELAKTFRPECAVVDLSLPGMHGIELGQHLRRLFLNDIYLIGLSGHAEPAIREGCLAAGFDAFLAKPGDIGELEQLLGRERPPNR